jgi:hypothetical protein
MIAKMKSNISVGETIGYNLKSESQLIAKHNLEGDHVQDFELQMRKTQELFEGRAKNLTAHIILSPSIEDGKKLTKGEWKEIANDYLKKANLEKYESIAFLHKDKEHTHLHIVANRIDGEGKIYRNGNELKLSQRIGNEIAKERGLKQAREVMLQNQLLREKGIEPKSIGGLQQLRDGLRNTAQKTTEENKDFNQDKYLQNLEKTGYKISRHLDKETGQVNGYSVEKDGCLYPSSKIGKEYTLRNLEKEYGQHQPEFSLKKSEGKEQIQNTSKLMEETIQLKRYDYLNDKEIIVEVPKRIQEDFKKELDNVKYENPVQLQNELEAKGIEVKMDIDKGRYSLTKEGHTLNASEIGKEYTLGNLEKSKLKKGEKQSVLKDKNLKSLDVQQPNRKDTSIQQMKESLQEKIRNKENEQMIEKSMREKEEGRLKAEKIKREQNKDQRQQL